MASSSSKKAITEAITTTNGNSSIGSITTTSFFSTLSSLHSLNPGDAFLYLYYEKLKLNHPLGSPSTYWTLTKAHTCSAIFTMPSSSADYNADVHLEAHFYRRVLGLHTSAGVYQYSMRIGLPLLSATFCLSQVAPLVTHLRHDAVALGIALSTTFLLCLAPFAAIMVDTSPSAGCREQEKKDEINHENENDKEDDDDDH